MLNWFAWAKISSHIEGTLTYVCNNVTCGWISKHFCWKYIRFLSQYFDHVPYKTYIHIIFECLLWKRKHKKASNNCESNNLRPVLEFHFRVCHMFWAGMSVCDEWKSENVTMSERLMIHSNEFECKLNKTKQLRYLIYSHSHLSPTKFRFFFSRNSVSVFGITMLNNTWVYRERIADDPYRWK